MRRRERERDSEIENADEKVHHVYNQALDYNCLLCFIMRINKLV